MRAFHDHSCFGVPPCLRPQDERRALRVAAFLVEYYSRGGRWADLRNSLPTITTRDRLVLVTVMLEGVPSLITDVSMRLLTPTELLRRELHHRPRRLRAAVAQGRLAENGGHSVSPPPYIATLKELFPETEAPEALAA